MMDEQRFDAMVARLEQASRQAPMRYRIKVALLATLGFGVLLVILLVSGVGIALIAAAALFAISSGAKAWLLLAKLGKFLILLAAPLWLLLKSSVTALLVRFPVPQGREITRPEAPALFAAIDELRRQMHGPAFHHVLVTGEMNAAIMQRPLFGLLGFPRNYLILGLPLLECLAPEEALAVIAHEYGHLSGAHARFSSFIYRLRNTWGSIQSIAVQWQGLAGSLLRRIIGWYAPFFNAYTFVLARANEFEADAASARLVGPQIAANALKRFNVANAHYREFMDGVYAGVRTAEKPPADIAEQWSRHALIVPAQAQATRWLDESLNRRGSAFDTHPVLRARLRALQADEEDAPGLPTPLREVTAAGAWFGETVHLLREAQQREWCAGIEDGWTRRHAELQAQHGRLADLREIATPSLEQTIERLRLQVALEPGTDHLPELAALNSRVADCAPLLYLEGQLLLNVDDPRGLVQLNRAMELDAAAIKPGCQLAYEYLTRKGDHELAQQYGQRWQERHAWEERRASELHSLNDAHELVTAQLDEQTRSRIQGLLESYGQGIAKVWLARRVLPSDASAQTYVLGFKLTLWARLRSQGPRIASTLAALEWPLHLFVCGLDSNKTMKRKLMAVRDAKIYSAK